MNRKETLEIVWEKIESNLKQGLTTTIKEDITFGGFNLDTYGGDNMLNQFSFGYAKPRVAPLAGRVVETRGVLFFSKGTLNTEGNLNVCQNRKDIDAKENKYIAPSTISDWEELPGQGDTVLVTEACIKCKSFEKHGKQQPCKSCETTIPTNFEAKDE